MIKLGDKRVAYIDSEKVIEKLDKQADKENRKRNNLLQQIVREYLDNRKNKVGSDEWKEELRKKTEEAKDWQLPNYVNIRGAMEVEDLDETRVVKFDVDPFDLHKSELEKMSNNELVEFTSRLIKKNKI